MDNKTQVQELLKAQDIIRRVYSEQKEKSLSDWLRAMDKDFSKVINIIGGMIENTEVN